MRSNQVHIETNLLFKSLLEQLNLSLNASLIHLRTKSSKHLRTKSSKLEQLASVVGDIRQRETWHDTKIVAQKKKMNSYPLAFPQKTSLLKIQGLNQGLQWERSKFLQGRNQGMRFQKSRRVKSLLCSLHLKIVTCMSIHLRGTLVLELISIGSVIRSFFIRY